MADTAGLEAQLLRFVRGLRGMGLRISLAEVTDAMRALEVVPIQDQKAVRTALKATLVKDTAGEGAFDHAFAVFFAPPAARLSRQEDRAEALAATARALEKAESELIFQDQPLNLNREDKLFYAHLTQSQQDRLQDFLQQTSAGKNVDRHFQPLVESLVRGHLNYWKRQMQNPGLKPPPPATGDTDAVADDLRWDYRPQDAIQYEDMARLDLNDSRQVELAIRLLTRRLATRISRRYRRSSKRDRVDLRKSLRENIRYGGAMVKLRYKTKKVQKPSLVVMCDVSGSMARYAGFVLQFCYGLAHVTRRIESFIFAEDLERISPLLKQGSSLVETMTRVMNKSRVWGEGTDFGRALARLGDEYPRLLTKQTVVIVLSDTKSLRAAEAAGQLAAMGRKVKEVIWLNTLPREDWQRYPSVAHFARASRMFPCNSLADLESIIGSRLLKA